jgi:hypothetical protein
MNRGKIRKGSRVKLNPESQFYSKNILMNENPTDCEGTVYDVDSIFLPIRVKWDNGTKNDYDESDLILLNQGENQRASVATDEDQGVAADPQITQDFKELNISLDGLCLQRGKDAGHSWIEFSDKFRAFEKRVLALSSEVERLRGEREAWNGEKRDLLDALEELMSWQNGAPLPTYQKGWTAAMERGEALLTKNKQP